VVRFLKYLEIFDPIILDVLVKMMHDFVRSKKPLEMFFHDQPVLPYISIGFCIRMIGSVN